MKLHSLTHAQRFGTGRARARFVFEDALPAFPQQFITSFSYVNKVSGRKLLIFFVKMSWQDNINKLQTEGLMHAAFCGQHASNMWFVASDGSNVSTLISLINVVL